MNNFVCSISNLTKRFNNQSEVLNNLNLTIASGKITCLVGLNGIGKTTIIKILLGLIQNYNGSVQLDHKDVKNYRLRYTIFHLPEKFNPPYNFTGREFIKISLNFYHIPINEEILHNYCQQINFNYEQLDKRISTYSKGMVQKIGVLAMLSSPTTTWILDEPMSGLDPTARYEVKQILKSNNALGKTIIFTSHLLADVEEMADNIIILHNGTICFNNNLEELFTQYNTNNIEEAYLKAINYY
ncbi:ABC transporter ATP-binding protein [Rickettsiales endosymbiont of Stachyamoeba lipophora]|uniref:ABC transporter ATP-binding protein n=1 Tax=Rickettsiales endosymbiont of Stachyamoeba lipophora TaxID=2486578 RepID=UPI000F64D707|nr:ABC transporter ATP-binding protein [Rickettsiales endosymbiont of Stachyamoeba lipophora]AZL15296.1 ABC transporter ATP-binding protein [Rickettsiales endosymbiont of Stachyamoeba lipophora]